MMEPLSSEELAKKLEKMQKSIDDANDPHKFDEVIANMTPAQRQLVLDIAVMLADKWEKECED